MRTRSSYRGALAPAACLLMLAGCGRAELSILTYNVAGLPQEMSASDPQHNVPLISPLLNEYDVVVVQEDFVVHSELASEATHPYRIPPGAAGSEAGALLEIPNGLGRFSRFPVGSYHPQAWSECNGNTDSGSDCLTRKGFAVAEHTIALGESTVVVDIYNLHMDSGDAPADEQARRAQVDQLLRVIARRSQDKAIIVAGDTNIVGATHDTLVRLRLGAGLLDACVELLCREPNRIDRVLYRSSEWVALEPLRWQIPPEFVDEDGAPLSDHLPVAVDFSVSALPPVPVADVTLNAP